MSHDMSAWYAFARLRPGWMGDLLGRYRKAHGQEIPQQMLQLKATLPQFERLEAFTPPRSHLYEDDARRIAAAVGVDGDELAAILLEARDLPPLTQEEIENAV